MRNLKVVIVLVVSVALVGIAYNVFAYGGMGWGHHGSGWYGQGDYDRGYYNQMSPEEYTQFQQEREAFFKETEKLRTDLFETGRELQNELAKSEPDAAKASKLQKEISNLQAQFDQKRIDHMIKMRKLNPNAGRGFMRGGPMMGQGYGHMMGRGYGHMMGDAPRGGGYCW
ncbi:MAG: periplasmic heavy metal sensor [Desulfobacteraceae bacterium]